MVFVCPFIRLSVLHLFASKFALLIAHISVTACQIPFIM